MIIISAISADAGFPTFLGIRILLNMRIIRLRVVTHQQITTTTIRSKPKKQNPHHKAIPATSLPNLEEISKDVLYVTELEQSESKFQALLANHSLLRLVPNVMALVNRLLIKTGYSLIIH